jgi:hypothetical protein
MAKIPAESIMEEELEAKRSSRARAMAKWKKEDPTQKFTSMIGETLTVVTEAVEDVLRGLEKVTIKDEEKARVEVLQGTNRKPYNETSAKFTRTEIGIGIDWDYKLWIRYLTPVSQWKACRRRRRS